MPRLSTGCEDLLHGILKTTRSSWVNIYGRPEDCQSFLIIWIVQGGGGVKHCGKKWCSRPEHKVLRLLRLDAPSNGTLIGLVFVQVAHLRKYWGPGILICLRYCSLEHSRGALCLAGSMSAKQVKYLFRDKCCRVFGCLNTKR